MLQDYLEKGDVDVPYVHGGQHEDKVVQEGLARNRIINYLQKKTGNRVHNRHDVKLGERFHEIEVSTWQQPIAWLTGALKVSNEYWHSHLAIGYVTGDGILAKLHNISRAWYHMQQFAKHGTIPVEFPLQTKSKLRILDLLDPHLWEHVWICENPELKDGEVSACGHCHPCLTMHGTLAMFEKQRGITYDEYVKQRIIELAEAPKLVKVDEESQPSLKAEVLVAAAG